MAKNKEIKTNAMRILEKNGVSFRTIQYVCDEFTDAIAVADLIGEPHEIVFKTLVTVGDDRQHYVFVIPIAEELDLKKAARSVGVKSVAMIHVKDINAVTGYIRGGCTAIGMKKQFVTRVDNSAEQLPLMIVSGGRIGTQIELSPGDLLSVSKAEYADLLKAHNE